MSLAVTEVGTGDRLVVFVHGVLGHGRSFDRVAALDEECTMRWYDRYGRCDEQVMHEVTAFLGERIPQFEVVTIPGAGHHAHRTAPHPTRSPTWCGVASTVGSVRGPTGGDAHAVST